MDEERPSFTVSTESDIYKPGLELRERLPEPTRLQPTALKPLSTRP
jgi:hypothetical protein